MIELDDGVIGPELLANFLAEHYLTGLLQQHYEDLHGLLPHADANAVLSQFTGADLKFERTKTIAAGMRLGSTEQPERR